MVRGTRDVANFPNDEGYAMKVQFADGKPRFHTHHGDVIGFESHFMDDTARACTRT